MQRLEARVRELEQEVQHLRDEASRAATSHSAGAPRVPGGRGGAGTAGATSKAGVGGAQVTGAGRAHPGDDMVHVPLQRAAPLPAAGGAPRGAPSDSDGPIHDPVKPIKPTLLDALLRTVLWPLHEIGAVLSEAVSDDTDLVTRPPSDLVRV